MVLMLATDAFPLLLVADTLSVTMKRHGRERRKFETKDKRINNADRISEKSFSEIAKFPLTFFAQYRYLLVERGESEETMDSTNRITEEDLLKRFEEIQEQMNELMKKYSIDSKKEPRENVDSVPVVIEPIFAYEIHASG